MMRWKAALFEGFPFTKATLPLDKRANATSSRSSLNPAFLEIRELVLLPEAFALDIAPRHLAVL